jgi:ABC-type glutathione transport system ATPase component
VPETLLEIEDLWVEFRGGRGLLQTKEPFHAVKGVDLAVESGEAYAVVGESGAGKSTLARCVVGLQRPIRGHMRFAGAPLETTRSRRERRAIQMVFQDPYSSLNPRMTVGAAIVELLRVNGLASGRAAARARAVELLELVGMSPSALELRPRAFSGGQRQRIGIARALAVEPTLLVADEPVSALDVSIQASILILLKHLQQELGLTLLFISHDLAVVRQLCDRVAVMRDGEVIERGAVSTVLAHPQHEFTKSLLAAATELPPLELELSACEVAAGEMRKEMQ